MTINDLFTAVFPNSELNTLKREYKALEERHFNAMEEYALYHKELDIYRERCKKLKKQNAALRVKLYSKSKKKLG